MIGCNKAKSTMHRLCRQINSENNFCYFLIPFVFFAFSSSSFAQNNANGWKVGASFHYGFVISHHPNMRHLVMGHTPAFELTVSQQVFGKKYWQQHYRYPVVGYSFFFIDLQNPKELGNAFALFPHISFPQKKQQKFMSYLRIGCGLGYITLVFDRIDNNKNNAIGSHFNVFFSFMYGFKWKVQKDFSIDGGISMMHFSNASIKAPNLGINIPTLQLGATWHFSDGKEVYLIDSITPPRDRKWHYSIIIAGGLKEIPPPGGPKYGVASLNAEVIKPVSRKSRLGLGLDVFYDASLEKKLKGDSADYSGIFAVVRPGLHLHYELKFDKFSMLFDVGSYLYTRWKQDGYIYAREGIQYRIAKNWLVGISLKTHSFKADMAEWGVGYEF